MTTTETMCGFWVWDWVRTAARAQKNQFDSFPQLRQEAEGVKKISAFIQAQILLYVYGYVNRCKRLSND